MIKKVICLSTILAVLLSLNVLGASINFEDVEEHWAKKEIYEMAEKWVILGYTDGTFKPDNNIIKSHAFLMFSRLMGYYDEENEVLIDEAIKEYSPKLQEAKITEGIAEISFLIKQRVVSLEYIIETLGNGKEREELSREETAYIFVQLLDDNEELNKFPMVTFNDANEIEEKYVAYVEYVNKLGLMIGYDNEFNPKGSVTRAQIATILSRIYVIVYNRTTDTVQGFITNIDLVDNKLILDDDKEYSLSKELEVFENTVRISKAQLDVNDYVKLYIENNNIKRIDIDNVEKSEYVVFKELIETENDKKIVVEQNGTEYIYLLTTDVKIIKDDKTSYLSSILENDKIEIQIKNNKIMQIIIGAFSYVEKGYIEQLVIGKQSKISLKNLYGEVNEYLLNDAVTFDFDGAQGNIYDLRLDMEISATITHKGITKIKVETLTNVEILKGKVKQILPKIFVFTIEVQDGKILMIFLDEEETIIKTSKGLICSIDEIEVNDEVSIYGRYEGEVFYPIQVIIN